MLSNMISLNKDKTEMITFHKIGTPRPCLKIKLNGKVIYPSKCVKYVGVHVDETLTFDYHCKFLWKKLNRALGMLFKCRHYLDSPQMKTLYFAIFNSHLVYGCQIWGQKRDTYTEKIHTSQNKAMRAITFSQPMTSQKPLYRQLGILNLEDFVKVQNCMFVSSALTKTSPICFHTYFKFVTDQHSYGTGQNINYALFVTARNTVRYGSYSIKNTCIRNWNEMAALFGPIILRMPVLTLKESLISYFLSCYTP